jgi:hypothetical protein
MLNSVREIGNRGLDAWALEAVAPHLTLSEQADTFSEMLGAAREIIGAKARAEVLRMLAPHLPEADQAGVLGEALAAARKIGNNGPRANLDFSNGGGASGLRI